MVIINKDTGIYIFYEYSDIKSQKGQQSLVFYNDGEYNNWKNSLENNTNGWTIKYFKGLGTSTSKEFKEYFANKKIVDFVYNGTNTDDSIDKIFNKKRTDDRKLWLEEYNKDSFLDTTRCNVKYEEFIDNELIHFSTYDCARSIPNMVDGLKISLRKILYSAFKRKLDKEIKVAQFSGYVSEHSAYHHGEASLNGAIVNMAQNYVGSNNINLLQPNGQFGTRLQGGDDSASERYIFTQLNPITRYLFPEMDDQVLNYLNDDGTMVEPEFYVPIIPFALVNGISGIGTGFSCNIPAFNPLDLISYLKKKIHTYINPQYANMDNNLQKQEFIPYYEGFNGTINKIEENKYLVKGVYEKIADDKIRITELPVGTWTMPYVSFLESLMDTTDKNGKITPVVKDFTSLSTEVNVDITVVFIKGKLDSLLNNNENNGINGLEKLLKLTSTLSTSNMHMFDSNRKLHKYSSVCEIIEQFYLVRYDLYLKRKEYLLKILELKLKKLSNKARYIEETLSDIVDLRKKSSTQVEELMIKQKYDKIDGDFKYLIKMPMDSVTSENVKNIIQDRDKAKQELEVLSKTTPHQMWLKELDILENNYNDYRCNRQKLKHTNTSNVKISKKKNK